MESASKFHELYYVVNLATGNSLIHFEDSFILGLESGSHVTHAVTEEVLRCSRFSFFKLKLFKYYSRKNYNDKICSRLQSLTGNQNTMIE
jgi:hypothetical protein